MLQLSGLELSGLGRGGFAVPTLVQDKSYDLDWNSSMSRFAFIFKYIILKYMFFKRWSVVYEDDNKSI